MSDIKVDSSLYTIMPCINPSLFTEEDNTWFNEFNKEHASFEEKYVNNRSIGEMFHELPLTKWDSMNMPEGASKSIILTNLPTRMKSTEGMQYELLLYFHQYGKIRDVYIPRNTATGTMKPYAFIEFLDISSAINAHADTSDGMILGGKKINVEFAVKGRKTADEMRLKGH